VITDVRAELGIRDHGPTVTDLAPLVVAMNPGIAAGTTCAQRDARDASAPGGLTLQSSLLAMPRVQRRRRIRVPLHRQLECLAGTGLELYGQQR